jgi:hypothetical protein
MASAEPHGKLGAAYLGNPVAAAYMLHYPPVQVLPRAQATWVPASLLLDFTVGGAWC